MRYVDDQAHDVIESTERNAYAGVADRRRPGRAPASSELLPLLRGAGLQDLDDEDEGRSPPLVGIAFAVALSIPLWLAIGTLVWLAG